MAQKDDIDPAGDVPVRGAVLNGLAQALAFVVREQADAFIARAAQGADTGAIDRTLRTAAAIARAACAVHALQAAEDKAAARALDAAARRMAAAVRAGAKTLDEGDETDMHERDARLDTAEGVAEVYQDAQRGMARVFRHLELKRADQRPDDAANGVGAVEKLDRQGERPTTPPH